MHNPAEISLRYVKGIGPKRAKALSKLGLRTVEDLLYYFPRRYEDRTHFTTIAKLQAGSTHTIKATVLVSGGRRSFRRRSFSITQVVVGDDTGKINCVWFNQPYLKEYFKVGTDLILYGKVEEYAGQLQMNSPDFEIISPANSDSDASDSGQKTGETLNIGRIVPVYTLPEGMSQRYVRQVVKNVLDKFLPAVNDFLPYDIRSRNNLLNLARSLITIHFPEKADLQLEAYRRLSFDEFFLFQIPLALRKLKKKEKPGFSHQVEGALVESFIDHLPFRLTRAQEKVISEIKTDMASPQVMHRLLQGDVGSGKTVVATIASLAAIQGNHQVAFMVPTEILAHQHFEKIVSQMDGLRSCARKIRVTLLTSSTEKKEKEQLHEEIGKGKVDLVIGTHALLEEGVQFRSLGLVVIDEQHKFGVGQRALLPGKGPNPDVLIMTATPIPRTLAITLYGDLDISIINELPPGRLPVKTLYFKEEERAKGYEVIKEQLRLRHQAYIVYPVIEESFVLDIAGARQMYEQLKAGELKEFRLGLVHGRLKQKEQDEMMSGFKRGSIDVLVATTVLEVGIDIPNATCMIIEGAHRFGLAQLHQLRGRVGRGGAESFCLLISDAQTPEARARLEAMVKYSDGFRIAEEDLKIRGPGEFFGRRQHGLAELRIANPLTQMQLLKRAREEVVKLMSMDPHLEAKQQALLREELLKRFPEYDKFIVVG